MADLEILPSLQEVLREADAVVSVVLPEAAESVARRCADTNLCRDLLFIDANSIDLDSLSSIHDALRSAGGRFVDAAIHGGASRLESMGVLYCSGAHSGDAEKLLGSALRVLNLGHQIGQATRMKMLMASQSKCLTMLFVEVAVLAHRAGMLEQLVGEARRFYPEIMTAVERMLPTYPTHSARRVGELQSIQRFAESVDAPHQMIQAACSLLQTVSGAWDSTLKSGQNADLAAIITSAAAAAADTREQS